MSGYSNINPLIIEEKQNLLRYPNGPLAPAEPITPTVDTFGAACALMNINPATNLLTNITDGSRTTQSGTGTKELSSAGNVGLLYFDLGSQNNDKNYLVMGRFEAWCSGGQVQIYIDPWVTGTTYESSPSPIFSYGVTDQGNSRNSGVQFIDTEKFRLRVYGTHASPQTYNIKLNTVIATPIGKKGV